MNDTSSSEQLVRELVATADRQRRARGASVVVTRFAPIAASAVLVLAVAGRFAAWPVAVIAAVWALLAVALLAVALYLRRPQPVSDPIAAGIDGDAELSGELRSAFWFATSASLDDWTRFHLDRALDRLRGISWNAVYPPVASRRAWVVTAVLTIAAFAIPVGVPSWSRPLTASSSTAPVALDVPVAAVEEVPADVQEQLAKLLEAVTSGNLSVTDAVASLREMTAFKTLDPDVQKELEELLRRTPADGEETQMAKAEDARGGPTSADVQWARENLASRMANEEAQKSDKDQAAKGEESESKDGPTTEQSAQGEKGEASEGQTSARVPIKSANGNQGSTGMMMKGDGTAGDPGTAVGGKRGQVRYGTTEATKIAAVLKREQVEAVTNLDNSDLQTEDRRKKTEQSRSALRYSRVAGRSTFDRARADAPNVVPEARRPLLERYFIRQATPDVTPAAGTSPGRRE